MLTTKHLNREPYIYFIVPSARFILLILSMYYKIVSDRNELLKKKCISKNYEECCVLCGLAILLSPNVTTIEA